MPDMSPDLDRSGRGKLPSPFRLLRLVSLSVFAVFLTLLLSGKLPFGQDPSAHRVLRVAVASNFYSTAKSLAEHFETKSDFEIVLSPGSTGKHYAQIISGAPFHLFLAADEARPRQLEGQSFGVPGTRLPYAIGRLVLVSQEPIPTGDPWQQLRNDEFRHLAIANPKLAPYGRAAEEVLTHRKMNAIPIDRLVRGENVAQTWHFLESGHADLAFVALSQVVEEMPDWETNGRTAVVEEDEHAPILQEMILLKDTPEGRAFFGFLQSEDARAIIEEAGYRAPLRSSSLGVEPDETRP